MRHIEARNKERNKQKKWPHDARLVHIDGTSCSPECMKTSDYHKEMDEQEFDRINRDKQQEKLSAATPTVSTVAIDIITSVTNSVHQYDKTNETDLADTSQQTQAEQLTVATTAVKDNITSDGTNMSSVDTNQQNQPEQLTVATPALKENTPHDEADTTNIGDKQQERKQSTLTVPENCESVTDVGYPPTVNENSNADLDTLPDSDESTVAPECSESVTDLRTIDPCTLNEYSSADQDVPFASDYNSNKLTGATNLTNITKRYNIDKSSHTASKQELPDIPDKTTGDTLPNIEPTTTDCNVMNIANPMDVNLPTDDLRLLEHNEFLDDFEMLMNLDNDLENNHLMSVDDAPILDVVNEMNKDAGVNQDLELAMDNARFIDETQRANVAPSSSRTITTSKQGTPVSPKGTFQTKTHGIRKLTPEERKDKKFKCEDCDFTAYSRQGVSNHYTDQHGPCVCEYCDRYFGNPHALKRHQYEHSSDKQYRCKDCHQEFYFQSELTAHRMKHRENPSFTCMANGCGRKFFRNSDLNAHVPVHSGVLHHCDHPGCTYSNLDKRLVTGHKRVHSDKKTFMCKYEECEEKFKHTNACLRHYKRDHQ